MSLKGLLLSIFLEFCRGSHTGNSHNHIAIPFYPQTIKGHVAYGKNESQPLLTTPLFPVLLSTALFQPRARVAGPEVWPPGYLISQASCTLHDALAQEIISLSLGCKVVFFFPFNSPFDMVVLWPCMHTVSWLSIVNNPLAQCPRISHTCL